MALGTVYHVQGGSTFCVCGCKPRCKLSMKAIEQHIPVVLFITLCWMVVSFTACVESISLESVSIGFAR